MIIPNDYSVSVQPLEIHPVEIDWIQGADDTNHVLFYQASKDRYKVSSSKLTASLIRAAAEYSPELLGHVVPADTIGGWKIVVDPADINWPLVTEVSTKKTLASLCKANYAWKQWPQEAHVDELHTQTVANKDGGRLGSPLLGLHIVRYACGGFSLHVKIRHQVMDGSAIWKFFARWAGVCNTASAIAGGVLYAHGNGGDALCSDRSLFVMKLSEGLSKEAIPPAGSHTDFTWIADFLRSVKEYHAHTARPSAFDYGMHKFHISPESAARLKRLHGSMAGCSPHNLEYVRKQNIKQVSANDLITALFWRAITRAHLALHPADPHTGLMMASDMRRRIDLPATYSGNASYPLFCFMTKQQMAKQTLTDTATWIRHRVNGLSPEYVQYINDGFKDPDFVDCLRHFLQPASSFFAPSILARVDIYGSADFGVGTPDHVGITPYLQPGFSISFPRKQAGSIEFNISLRDDVFKHIQSDAEFNQFITTIV
ncbi:hypothetical protein GGI12_004676 [Dipsacomyces acuminosporus]|nr:hypothetical protein GGI12_004676 [Dipsacomyces acuminosporus]